MRCQHSTICGNCTWMDLSTEEQRERKLAALRQRLELAKIEPPKEILFFLPPPGRDRVDLIFSQGRYGFYQRQDRSLFEIQECPQMSPGLFSFFSDLKKVSLPIHKGSLRLRISPEGTLRGLWLDFANKDIQFLFQEQKTLHRLMGLAFVEVGQKKKKLSWDGQRFRLQDPEYHPWTQTWIQNQAFPLASLVGNFSQTGEAANQMIIRRLESFFNQSSAQRWVEFGCGQGNLTLPLAAHHRQVLAVEYDQLALFGLKKTLEADPDLQERIQLLSGDFQFKHEVDFSAVQGLLLNPPRSGVQNFLASLSSQEKRPQDLIYMSCFLDSFCKDALEIKRLCYKLESLEIIDQFPQTPHFEILSRWSQ